MPPDDQSPRAQSQSLDERLRAMSRLSSSIGAATPRVEMDPEAIDRRLREVADLTAACLELVHAGSRAG